jgi:hypothetical protein
MYWGTSTHLGYAFDAAHCIGFQSGGVVRGVEMKCNARDGICQSRQMLESKISLEKKGK